MKTFCPAGGKVLDPFAATMTVGIASIQTGGSCVLLESDKECFSLAERRLREYAKKYLEDCEHPEPPDEFRKSEVYRNQTGDNTNPDSPNCDSMQVCGDETQYERKEDECEARHGEKNSRDVGEANESNSHSDIVPGRAMSAKGPDCSMQDGEQDCIPASCRTLLSSPGSSDDCITERATELTTRVRDLATTENDTVTKYKANEITSAYTSGKKAKYGSHVAIMESACTERRPQRKRKKTARYA